MLVHVAGVMGCIGSIILVSIIHSMDVTLQSQIAFLLAALSIIFGAAGWALKENEAEKNPIYPTPRVLWTTLVLIVLGFGLIPYIRAWGENLYAGQYVFLVFVIPISAFIVWVQAKKGDEEV